MKCEKFIFRNNGKVYSFSSESELSSFLINNKNRLNSIDKNPDIKFSKEFDKQEEMFSAIKALNESNIKSEYTAYGDSNVQSEGYISVTKAITMPNLWESGKPLVTGMNQEDYFEKLKAALLSRINPDTEKFYTESEIENVEKELQLRWKQLAKFGTAIHKIAEIFFNDPSLNKENILEIFKATREYKEVNFSVAQIDNMIDYVFNVKKSLVERYPDCKFIPEIKLRTKNNTGHNFVGKIDLLVIDKNGDPHIFDFKTSPVHYTEFHQVKELTFTYQLAFYRQMLSHLGFNTTKTELGILPIELTDIDYENNTVNHIRTEGVVDMSTGAEGGSDYRSRITKQLLPGGKISNRLNTIIPVKKMEFSLSTAVSDHFDSINKELFGYDAENNSGLRSKKTLDAIKEKVKQNSNGQYVVRDDFTGEVNYYDSKEMAYKKIDEIYEKNQNDKLYYAQEIANNYRAAFNRGSKSFFFAKDANKTNNYNTHYGLYLKEGYKLNENLLPHGILVFYHESYKTVDFVFINNEELSDKVVDLKFGRNGTKITGNLIPDKDAPKYTLDGRVGNIELMRLMVAINEFMPSVDSDYSVNELKIINNFNYKVAHQDNDLLRKNFNILIREANKQKGLDLKNNFEEGDHKIKMVDSVTRLMNKLDSILSDESLTKYSYLEDTKASLTQLESLSLDMKLKRLVEIADEISEYATGYTGKILDPLANTSDPISSLYYLVQDAIRETKGLYFEYQYEDIQKMSLRSELITTAQLSSVKIIGEVQSKIIDVGKGRMQKRFNDEATPIKVYCEDYLKDGNKIDSSLNAFDGLIERYEGQCTIFRVKDPRDNKLTDYQRTFLMKWLTSINKIRYPDTDGDMNSPEAAELVRTGEWFDIPLMEGGVVNKGRKGIGKAIKDKLEIFINPAMILAPQAKKHQTDQLNKFQHYVNPLKITGQDRENFMAQAGLGYFSRNLAEIAINYMYHDVLEKEYNEMLPYIRSALICANVVNLFTKSEMEDALKIMLEKYQSEVYKVNHISTSAQSAYKVYSLLSGVANDIALMMNPISFVRELTTGRYNNYGRILTHFGGKDAPSAADLTKAYMIVDLQGAQALFLQNKMNGINMRWNIGGRAITEMKESHRAQRSPILNLPFKSAPMYTMSQLPDYEHRLSLFIAYMIKEGCYDAYEYNDQTQMLEYNFAKDERFKCVATYKQTGRVELKDKENLAKYQLLLEEFNAELPEGEKLKFGDALPDGISENKVKSIKNISNQIHGNLDADTAMHFKRYFAGKVFTKFQTYLSAKILNNTLSPDKYQMMEEQYAVDEVSGKYLYLKRTYNPETRDYDVSETTDLTDPDCTGQHILKYQPRQEAGTLSAILDVYDILCHKENRLEKYNLLKSDESKIADLKFLIGDLLMLLFSSIFGSMLGITAMQKTDKGKADLWRAALLNPATENNPVTLVMNALSIIDSPVITIPQKALNATINFATKEDATFKAFMYTFGFGKYSAFF